MINNIQNLINELCFENNITEEFVLTILEEGIKTAWTYEVGDGYDICIQIQNSKFGNVFKCIRKIKVVEEVQFPQREINIADVDAKIYPLNSIIEEEIKLNQFSRKAITIVDEYIKYHIKNQKKKIEYEVFSDKIGTIITGIIKATSIHGIIININGKYEGIITDCSVNPLMKYEYTQGKKIKAYLYKVENNLDQFQLFLSRKSKDFLIGLFTEEVLEIKHGLIEVVAAVRGHISILLVRNKDTFSRINPVGVLIGQGGIHIKKIQEEIKEKIYILPWKDLLYARLQTVLCYNGQIPIKKIISHEDNENEEDNFLDIFVPGEYVSKLIGPKGRNINLISKLLNIKIRINVYEEKEEEISFYEKNNNLKKYQQELEISDEELKIFLDLGITDIQELINMSFQDFLKINLINNNHGTLYKKILSCNLENNSKKEESISNIENIEYSNKKEMESDWDNEDEDDEDED